TVTNGPAVVQVVHRTERADELGLPVVLGDNGTLAPHAHRRSRLGGVPELEKDSGDVRRRATKRDDSATSSFLDDSTSRHHVSGQDRNAGSHVVENSGRDES